MGRFHSYIHSALSVLEQYRGEEPLASFLKKFFSAQKKFGSRDRRSVSHLCYSYFRAAKLFDSRCSAETILAALFLCTTESNEILAALKPEWNEQAALPVREKLSLLGIPAAADKIFPWKEELSEGIDQESFALSMLVQPDLFLRTRPGMKRSVLQKLSAAGCHYSLAAENCIALPNTTPVEKIIELNREAVIQDFSSQRVGEFLEPVLKGPSFNIWDCCAASGGKSILARDILGEAALTVSDVRESILANLKKRFRQAGITKYKACAADLTKPLPGDLLPGNGYSLIIADLPCTGSGTWSRTPEQLYYFDTKKTVDYAALQQKILAVIIPALKPGGYLLYITCSVFKKENEEIADLIKEQFHLVLKKMEWLKGYDKKADSMFAALFQLPL
ncbi:MAG: methyltransferase domain-containing protein [Chitinophagaceae bacterium]